MNKNWTLTLLLTAVCSLPLAAQVKQSAKDSLQNALERAAATAEVTAASQDNNAGQKFSGLLETARDVDAADESSVSSAQQLLSDETQRQAAQNRHYLPSEQVPAVHPDLRPLTPREEIEAEEELSLLISRKDNHATFAKYPYLRDPAYRRANEETKEQIRNRFKEAHYATYNPHKANSLWAWKVGL